MNTLSQSTSQYKHNINIPGWNEIQFLDILAATSAAVPENGVIIELGALFGRSTYTIGHNKKPSVMLLTLDVWPTMKMGDVFPVTYVNTSTEQYQLDSALLGNPATLHSDYFFGLWSRFTNDIVNKQGIRANVTNVPLTTFPMADLIFHDAGHGYDEVYVDLTRWLTKLKPEGIIIVDDYDTNTFPGVVQAVDQVIAENNLVSEMVTNRNILLRRK